ncbi:MAG: hypothetical protein KF841_02900 [Phycisphaerae bacterium]|nr:hypothetical protein [Phycisphaerae bacterium]
MVDDIECRIVRAIDIVEVIHEKTAVSPLGDEWIARCPFHHDMTYSLGVSPYRQEFRCLACGAAGNVIDFVRSFNRIHREDAVQMLAHRAGLNIEPR